MKSPEERAKLEMKYQLLVLLISAAIYYFARDSWNPTGFNPLNYILVGELGFGETMLKLLPVAVIVPFIFGQLDWLNSNMADRLEKGRFIRAPMRIKLLRSVFAGFVEEIGFRGFFIYTAMLAIAISNANFELVITILFAFVFGQKVPGSKTRLIAIVRTIVLITGYLVMRSLIFPGFVYKTMEVYIRIYEWVLAPENRLTIALIFACIWAADSLILIVDVTRNNATTPNNRAESRRQRFLAELYTPSKVMQQILVTGGLLALNFWIITQINAATILSGPSLLVMGITVSFYRFGMGHSYQGWQGTVSSLFFGIYMQFVTFTFGLAYAVIVHSLYNSTLYVSEHIAQSIKDRAKLRASISPQN